MELPPDASLPELGEATLVVPAVSVGNVGQLCCDVLLATLQPPPQLLAQVHHPALIQVVGPDPLHSKDNDQVLTTAMQLYTASTQKGQKLAILQIRSGVLAGMGEQFMKDLLEWSKVLGIKRIICLTSSHSHERQDCQLSGSPLRYLVSPDTWLQAPQGSLRLEGRERFPAAGADNHTDSHNLYIPGGGLARRLFLSSQAQGINTAVLLKFCSEGDNTGDALALAHYLDQFIQFSHEDKYRTPPSWKFLFGQPAPSQMFG